MCDKNGTNNSLSGRVSLSLSPPPFISMLLYSLHFHSGFASNTLLLELKYFRMKSFSQIGVSEFLLFFSTISGMEVMSFFSLSVSLVRRIGDLGEE